MDEVSPQTQAELELKLSDNVRELIRQHVRDAFNDPVFMDYLAVDLLHRKLEIRSYGSGSFAQAVRGVIAQQMNKY
jgi:hypothetical protein